MSAHHYTYWHISIRMAQWIAVYIVHWGQFRRWCVAEVWCICVFAPVSSSSATFAFSTMQFFFLSFFHDDDDYLCVYLLYYRNDLRTHRASTTQLTADAINKILFAKFTNYNKYTDMFAVALQASKQTEEGNTRVRWIMYNFCTRNVNFKSAVSNSVDSGIGDKCSSIIIWWNHFNW